MKMTISNTERSIGMFDNGDEFEFDFEPSQVIEPLVFRKDNTMIVGYLSHDDDVQHPLKDFKGNGKIHTLLRDASKDERDSFYEALGFDQYGCRDEDLPINPYAVLLDCYEHGNQIWSISGSAEARSFPDQQFDVSHGAGVWVPDKDSKNQCDERAAVYAFVILAESSAMKDGKLVNEYKLTPADGVTAFDQNHESFNVSFARWHDAFDAASSLVKEYQVADLLGSPTEKQIEQGNLLAKIELAERACNTQNTWASGETYGVVTATYTKEDGEDEWELDSSDESWGILGTDNAEIELNDLFKDACSDLEAENTMSLR